MTKPSYVYVTYIVTTPEKLWNALIDPEQTKRYWGNHRNASDWKVGSSWRHEDYDDPGEVDIVGTVLESDPPRRLVISWADPDSVADPAKTSRVSFDLAQLKHAVRLTVTHAELQPDSEMLRGIMFGWPAVLAGLKTMLETGNALSRIWAEEEAEAAGV